MEYATDDTFFRFLHVGMQFDALSINDQDGTTIGPSIGPFSAFNINQNGVTMNAFTWTPVVLQSCKITNVDRGPELTFVTPMLSSTLSLSLDSGDFATAIDVVRKDGMWLFVD